MKNPMAFMLTTDEAAELGECLATIANKQYPGPSLREKAKRLMAKLDEQALANLNEDRGKEAPS